MFVALREGHVQKLFRKLYKFAPHTYSTYWVKTEHFLERWTLEKSETSTGRVLAMFLPWKKYVNTVLLTLAMGATLLATTVELREARDRGKAPF
jgi:hypothetical protein